MESHSLANLLKCVLPHAGAESPLQNPEVNDIYRWNTAYKAQKDDWYAISYLKAKYADQKTDDVLDGQPWCNRSTRYDKSSLKRSMPSKWDAGRKPRLAHFSQREEAGKEGGAAAVELAQKKRRRVWAVSVRHHTPPARDYTDNHLLALDADSETDPMQW